MWQDYLITLSVVAFSYALLPQIYQGYKQKKGFINSQTSLITLIGMYALTYTYFSMGFLFSSIITFISGTLWLTLFIQKLIYK